MNQQKGKEVRKRASSCILQPQNHMSVGTGSNLFLKGTYSHASTGSAKVEKPYWW